MRVWGDRRRKWVRVFKCLGLGLGKFDFGPGGFSCDLGPVLGKGEWIGLKLLLGLGFSKLGVCACLGKG